MRGTQVPCNCLRGRPRPAFFILKENRRVKKDGIGQSWGGEELTRRPSPVDGPVYTAPGQGSTEPVPELQGQCQRWAPSSHSGRSGARVGTGPPQVPQGSVGVRPPSFLLEAPPPPEPLPRAGGCVLFHSQLKKKNNKSFCWASQGPRHKEETGRPQEGGMGRGTAGRGPEGVVTARDLGEPEPPDCPWAPSGPCRPEGPAGNVGRGGAGPSGGGAGSGFILLLPPTPAASGMSLSGGRESGLWKEP